MIFLKLCVSSFMPLQYSSITITHSFPTSSEKIWKRMSLFHLRNVTCDLEFKIYYFTSYDIMIGGTKTYVQYILHWNSIQSHVVIEKAFQNLYFDAKLCALRIHYMLATLFKLNELLGVAKGRNKMA